MKNEDMENEYILYIYITSQRANLRTKIEEFQMSIYAFDSIAVFSFQKYILARRSFCACSTGKFKLDEVYNLFELLN